MWTKICGICDARTAVAVAELGARALGLNFYPPSPRSIPRTRAAEIAAAVPATVELVGVFVNMPVGEVEEIAAECRLAAVQLHGDEPPDVVAALQPRRVIRAFRVGEAGLGEVAEYLQRCGDLGVRPWGVLIDSAAAGAYGGTGRTAPWDLLRDYDPAWPPLILAGGLRPSNVAAAIATVRPFGVDTASGVESSPGVKDLALVRDFLAAAGRSSRDEP